MQPLRMLPLLLLLLLLAPPVQSDWATLDAAELHLAQQCSAAAPFQPQLCEHAPAPSSPQQQPQLQPLPAPAPAPQQLLRAAWALAEAQSAMRRHAPAAALRASCLAHANASAGLAALPWASAAAAHSALAHDLRHSRAYPQALAAVAEALRAAPPASPTAAGLQAFHAELLSCSGEARAVEALAALARARKAAAGAGGDEAGGALQELDLLRRALRAPGLPPALARGLAAKYQRLVDGMLAAGPWRHPLQLPRWYEAGLLALPWHSAGGVEEPGAGGSGGGGGELAPPAAPPLPEGWPSAALAAAARALSAAAPALLREYQALRDGGHLEPETECIAEPRWEAAGAGSSGARGDWRVFTANAWWRRPLDEGGCSAALAPVACGLLRSLRDLGLRVQRLGYSALWPGALLHPHYGQSNGVLKLHLGVRVPVGADGRGCAALTVGNETRRWAAGGVLAFDDSWLHSVEYGEGGGCGGGGERVVLQVVLAHPQAVAVAAGEE